MGFLTNTWVKYWDRSYEQIKNSVLAIFGYRVPEITDHTESNVYVRMIDIFAGMHEQLGYYVDNMAREAHISSARLYSSMIAHARAADYKVIGNVPFEAGLIFSIPVPAPSDIIIPTGTICRDPATSIPYRTVEETTISTGQMSSSIVSALQYEPFSGMVLGLSTGQPNMVVEMAQKVAHNSVALTIAGDVWDSVDSLGYYTIGDTKKFVQNVDESGNVILMFGNDIFGAIPTIGEQIIASYNVTLGASGAAAANTITEVVSAISLPVGVNTITVNNPQAATGGTDVESLEKLRRSIPAAVRTLNRAVTKKDFLDVALMAPGVANAGGDYSCGTGARIYIVPEGGGIAGSVLIASTEAYIKERAVFTVGLVVKSAGQIRISLNIQATALPGHFNAVVRQNIIDSLTAFGAYDYQDIGGSIYLSDLYQAIEGSVGVRNSIISSWGATPYASPSDTTTQVLNWSVAVNNTSAYVVPWRILFLSSTSFNLYRNGIMVGNHNVGDTVSYGEVTFVVSANSYANGFTYTFVTYPSSPKVLQLTEPSLPVILSPDITVTVTGGLV